MESDQNGASRIMLVDDDDVILSVLGDGLRDFGYDVHTFSNPLRALERYLETSPDLVVLDYEMPDMDGAELARQMLSRMYRPIITLSVRHDEDSWCAAASAGVLNYLVKPVSAIQLRPAIETTLTAYGDLQDVLASQGPNTNWSVPGNAGAVLDQLDVGIISLSSELEVLGLNRMAGKLVDHLDGFSGEGANLSRANTSLGKILQAFAQDLARNTQAEACKLGEEICPVFMRRTKPGEASRIILMLLNPESGVALNSDLVSAFYGLTARETRLAIAIADGMKLEDFCEHYHVTQNTVKSQLKSVFAKVDVHSQAELVSRLASLQTPLS